MIFFGMVFSLFFFFFPMVVSKILCVISEVCLFKKGFCNGNRNSANFTALVFALSCMLTMLSVSDVLTPRVLILI